MLPAQRLRYGRGDDRLTVVDSSLKWSGGNHSDHERGDGVQSAEFAKSWLKRPSACKRPDRATCTACAL